jgi:hypothetical protein
MRPEGDDEAVAQRAPGPPVPPGVVSGVVVPPPGVVVPPPGVVVSPPGGSGVERRDPLSPPQAAGPSNDVTVSAARTVENARLIPASSLLPMAPRANAGRGAEQVSAAVARKRFSTDLVCAAALNEPATA